MKNLRSCETIPEIKIERRWIVNDVMQACVRNELYTHGYREDYEAMLEMVRKMEPTTEAIYLVAKDIQEHSDSCWQVHNVMFVLEREAVTTFFHVDGEDDY